MIDGNANSVELIKTSTAHATDISITVKESAGVVIIGSDHTSQPKTLQVQAGAKVTMIGGNFESAIGGTDGIVEVQQNGALVHIGGRFLKGSGADIPPYLVQGYSTCHVFTPTANEFTTAPGMKLMSATAQGTVSYSQDTTGSYTGGFTIEDANGERYHNSAFTQRPDNSVPTASAANRGMVLHVVGRSGVAADRLVMCMRDAAGTGYSWVTLGTA